VVIRSPRFAFPVVPRIETVPASMVNFLIDFGVHPKRIGVDRFYEIQLAAWEGSDPVSRRGRALAHVNRDALQRELLSIARRTPQLAIVDDSCVPTRLATGWGGSGWSARHLFDATGRAAVLARQRVAAPKPWVARPFWNPRPASPHLRSFRIAALPFGYVYRLGSNESDTLWIAGRGRSLSASPKVLEEALIRAGASWVLEGLPHLSSLATGRAFPVSVQWAQDSAGIAVGDAALARDVLSSQGIAAGFSSACYALACRSLNDTSLLLQHQCAERASHLKSLSRVISSSCHAGSTEWRRYGRFVAAQLCSPDSQQTIGLSDGRLVRHYGDFAAAASSSRSHARIRGAAANIDASCPTGPTSMASTLAPRPRIVRDAFNASSGGTSLSIDP